MRKLPFFACPLLVLSCAGRVEPPDPLETPSGDCAKASAAARDRVAKVAHDNLACSSDSDCSSVPLRASCFDACTASVNQAGKGAVDRASTLVEAAECKSFHHDGCELASPSCAPPLPTRCEAGICR